MANTTPIQFRIATPNDAAQIAHLIQSAFRADDARPNWTADVQLNRSFNMTPAEVLSTISNPNTVFLMATSTSDDLLIATITAIKRSDGVGRLAMLAIDQSYQRGGLGRRVLEYAEEYAKTAWGVERIGLDAVNTRESLIEWYERMGYKRTGETTPFPREKFPGRILSEDLHFVQLEKDVQGEKSV